MLDHGSFADLEVLTIKYNEESKRSWEQARLIAYIVAQVNSAKRLRPEEIIKFPWDGGDTEQKEMLTREEVRQRAEKAARLYGINLTHSGAQG